MKYDVIVVGAGPAGSAAARTLALEGIKVCIIDKCEFPRQKLCGSLLTLRCKKQYDKVFGVAWQEVILQESHAAEFYNRDELIHRLEDEKPLYNSDRLLFDHFLLKQAVQAGAEQITGNAVRAIDPASNQVILADGSKIGYQYLIGCDGAHSVVARTLYGKALPKYKAAAALEIDLPLAQTTYSTDCPQIFFGIVHWGYAWIFPKGDRLTIGLGALAHKNGNLRDIFTEFLLSRLGYVPDIRFQGHLVPFCAFRRKPGKGNIMLCGDAAGLVDPITGEGIAFAIQSGYLAATAIGVHFGNNRAAFDAYNNAYQQIRHNLQITARLSNLIYPRLAERLFLQVFPRASSVARLHMNLMADEITYPTYHAHIISKLGRGLLRKLGR